MRSNIRAFVESVRAMEQVTRESQALFDSLSSDEKKQAIESRVFVKFAETTMLLADPLEHTNEDPPRPDILARVDGRNYYFELGEITDELHAQNISLALKSRMATGCAHSAVGPLREMMYDKCSRKSYDTNGSPVDLLLYYWRQEPYGEALQEFLSREVEEIEPLFEASNFQRIWIYDWPRGQVLWKHQRASGSSGVRSAPILGATGHSV
jgi:hypothetical protein